MDEVVNAMHASALTSCARGLKITPMKDPWPEVDLCVGGVDKGSALARFLQQPEVLTHLGQPSVQPHTHVAVFGDAANDVPMFRAIGGHRPALRVGMPHASHDELVQLSNVRAEVSEVLWACCAARVLSRAADGPTMVSRATWWLRACMWAVSTRPLDLAQCFSSET